MFGSTELLSKLLEHLGFECIWAMLQFSSQGNQPEISYQSCEVKGWLLGKCMLWVAWYGCVLTRMIWWMSNGGRKGEWMKGWHSQQQTQVEQPERKKKKHIQTSGTRINLGQKHRESTGWLMKWILNLTDSEGSLIMQQAALNATSWRFPKWKLWLDGYKYYWSPNLKCRIDASYLTIPPAPHLTLMGVPEILNSILLCNRLECETRL